MHPLVPLSLALTLIGGCRTASEAPVGRTVTEPDRSDTGAAPAGDEPGPDTAHGDTAPGDSAGDDTGCTSSDPSGTVRTIRITTEESPSWVAWHEVAVQGSLDGGDSTDLTSAASVSVSSGASTAELAVDGDPSTSWNAEDFPTQWIQLDFDAPVAVEELHLTVAQTPSGATVHVVETASACGVLEQLERFEEETWSGGQLSYEAEVESTDGSCGELDFDLVLKKTSAPCWDCEFWFDPMEVEEQRPALEVTYTSAGVTETAVFQDGPLGTDGDLISTFIMGADALLGPGSCPLGDEACYADFLHKIRTQVWDGVHYYNGLVFSDISSIPCGAEIDEAKLWLWIHQERGLANSDATSTASFYRGVRDWDYRYVNGVRYNVDSAGNDLHWTTAGGDIGAHVRDLEAQADFWERGFHKASPNAWFDFTDHVQELQDER